MFAYDYGMSIEMEGVSILFLTDDSEISYQSRKEKIKVSQRERCGRSLFWAV